MQKEVEQNRRIAVVLDGSGTLRTLEQTQLYCGGFGLVTLQCYVPVTAAQSSGTEPSYDKLLCPLCTVYRSVTDTFFVQRRYANDAYNLLLVSEEAEIDGKTYMLFERPLPKSFTEKTGELKMVFAYSELELDKSGDPDKSEKPVGKTVSRLISGMYVTHVCDGLPKIGGALDSEPVTDPLEGERAQINDNTRRIGNLECCLWGGQERVLVDFNIVAVTGEDGAVQYYHGTKFFNDGTTEEKCYSVPTEMPTLKTDMITTIEFDKTGFSMNGSNKYELAIPSAQTGITDNKYISVLEYEDEADGEAGKKSGYSVSGDSHFKGSDGSILIRDVVTPFNGRLLIFNGAKYTSYKDKIDKAIEDAAVAEAEIKAEKDRAEGAETALGDRVKNIEGIIPNQASADNRLADKDFVNSSIEQMAATRVTYDVDGSPFPTYDSLVNALSYFSGGKEYTPNEHDYAIVIADESRPKDDRYLGGQTRYTYEKGQWTYAYGINDRPFTDAERKAIESGITVEIVEEIKQISEKAVRCKHVELLDSKSLDGDPYHWFDTGTLVDTDIQNWKHIFLYTVKGHAIKGSGTYDFYVSGAQNGGDVTSPGMPGMVNFTTSEGDTYIFTLYVWFAGNISTYYLWIKASDASMDITIDKMTIDVISYTN